MTSSQQGPESLAERFEAQRGRLRTVAYRMLGSLPEAEDAVQETWLRLSRTDPGDIDHLEAWLRTVVSRLCLDMLRSRAARREDPLEWLMPAEHGQLPADTLAPDPAREAELIDAVGRAMLVVLDTLTPAERVAFVLHDLFAVPFEQVAAVVDRTPVAAKKLASRARQRVRGTTAAPAAELARQRQVVEAFLAAAREGDLAALLAVLDPDVVRRADQVALAPGGQRLLRGAAAVARQTLMLGRRARFAAPILVNGSVGAVVAPHGRLSLVIAFTTVGDRVVEYDVIADPARLREIDLAVPRDAG